MKRKKQFPSPPPVIKVPPLPPAKSNQQKEPNTESSLDHQLMLLEAGNSTSPQASEITSNPASFIDINESFSNVGISCVDDGNLIKVTPNSVSKAPLKWVKECISSPAVFEYFVRNSHVADGATKASKSTIEEDPKEEADFQLASLYSVNTQLRSNETEYSLAPNLQSFLTGSQNELWPNNETNDGNEKVGITPEIRGNKVENTTTLYEQLGTKREYYCKFTLSRSTSSDVLLASHEVVSQLISGSATLKASTGCMDTGRGHLLQNYFETKNFKENSTENFKDRSQHSLQGIVKVGTDVHPKVVAMMASTPGSVSRCSKKRSVKNNLSNSAAIVPTENEPAIVLKRLWRNIESFELFNEMTDMPFTNLDSVASVHDSETLRNLTSTSEAFVTQPSSTFEAKKKQKGAAEETKCFAASANFEQYKGERPVETIVTPSLHVTQLNALKDVNCEESKVRRRNHNVKTRNRSKRRSSKPKNLKHDNAGSTWQKPPSCITYTPINQTFQDPAQDTNLCDWVPGPYGHPMYHSHAYPPNSYFVHPVTANTGAESPMRYGDNPYCVTQRPTSFQARPVTWQRRDGQPEKRHHTKHCTPWSKESVSKQPYLEQVTQVPREPLGYPEYASTVQPYPQLLQVPLGYPEYASTAVQQSPQVLKVPLGYSEFLSAVQQSQNSYQHTQAPPVLVPTQVLGPPFYTSPHPTLPMPFGTTVYSSNDPSGNHTLWYSTAQSQAQTYFPSTYETQLEQPEFPQDFGSITRRNDKEHQVEQSTVSTETRNDLFPTVDRFVGSTGESAMVLPQTELGLNQDSGGLRTSHQLKNYCSSSQKTPKSSRRKSKRTISKSTAPPMKNSSMMANLISYAPRGTTKSFVKTEMVPSNWVAANKSDNMKAVSTVTPTREESSLPGGNDWRASSVCRKGTEFPQSRMGMMAPSLQTAQTSGPKMQPSSGSHRPNCLKPCAFYYDVQAEYGTT